MSVIQAPASGHVTLFNGLVRRSGPNSPTAAAAYVAAKLHAGDMGYRVSHVYMEFINLDNPGDTFIYPVFDPASDSKAHYDALQGSTDERDFIRVPVGVTPEPTDTPTTQVLPLVASTSGNTVGFWGREFSKAANSYVYGLALVASPKNNFGSDIVIARAYRNPGVPKIDGDSVVMSWTLGFTKAGA